MNDLEREVRDTFLRRQGEAPPLDISDARRAAGRARRRQVRTVIVGGIAGAAAVIVAIAGFGGLVRADRPPTVLHRPPSTCVATPGSAEAGVHGWPTTTRNRAGVYSWGGRDSARAIEGFMHNGYRPGSGAVTIRIDGVPGLLIPHPGQTAVTVAGCEATHQKFGSTEVWMVDVQGTTVTIRLVAEHGALKTELAEAREIIGSIRIKPRDNDFGFRLIFTLATNTWDSG